MEMPMRTIRLFAAFAALAAFCSLAFANGADVQSGTWAGQHIVMEVTSTGATVEFDCAHGTLDAPLALDSGGRFEVSGSFTPERGGPTRGDSASRAVPARYTGSLDDSTLTVTVVLTENKVTVGVFTLRHGARARLFKCK
jgi:hypothetical protein